MQINDKDAGAYMVLVSGGGTRGLAGGTGDNTEDVGAIVDSQAQPGLTSGMIVLAGSATLAEDKVLDLKDVKIEHGDDSGLSDKADYTWGKNAKTTHSAVATGGSGGSTETFAVKQRVDLTGIKRYWRVSVIPDLDASGTDVFEFGYCVCAIGEAAPQS
jgi:hypothetical protein